MSKTAVWMLFLLALLTLSCGNKKHDVAYYEQMVDSIRRAEQVKLIQKKAGIYENPVEAWFDTLHLHSLPIQTAGADVDGIGHFDAVPAAVNGLFGFADHAHLKAMALPSIYRRQVVLLCEMKDSITPALYLFTMDRKHQAVDQLCIYRQEEGSREGEKGLAYDEYFITSHYEITVMHYFKDNHTDKPALMYARRYNINKEGMFEEQIIEYDKEPTME